MGLALGRRARARTGDADQRFLAGQVGHVLRHAGAVRASGAPPGAARRGASPRGACAHRGGAPAAPAVRARLEAGRRAAAHHERVVEAREDVRNAEHLLALASRRPRRDGGVLLHLLPLLGRLRRLRPRGAAARRREVSAARGRQRRRAGSSPLPPMQASANCERLRRWGRKAGGEAAPRGGWQRTMFAKRGAKRESGPARCRRAFPDHPASVGNPARLRFENRTEWRRRRRVRSFPARTPSGRRRLRRWRQHTSSDAAAAASRCGRPSPRPSASRPMRSRRAAAAPPPSRARPSSRRR